MHTAPATNDTTPLALVEVPAVTLPQWAGLVAELQAQFPDSASRIARGAAIVAHGTIYTTATLGLYRVESCQQAGTLYTTTSAACDCPDAAKRALQCKHSWAATLLSCASAIASFDRAQARYTLTTRGARALAAVGV